ncbi:hypothetical protein FGD67_06520 [Colwellia sp. M166]|uniref:hypothetical protein n=1 Tax=Colwellia sp. M166 TaxID=2583805 RepID=UPI00211E39DF|nr:hypothetical protein [Colwellia sp. M166]UUO22881.1 hypothetical protein FGD67_06520 [Colwellia sp. M166]
MSMPTYKVCCDKCDYEAWSLKLWGAKEYIDSEGQRIPVDVTLNWCNECQSLEPVESFDHTEEYVKKLKEALNNIKDNTNSVPKLFYIRLMSWFRGADQCFLNEALEYTRKIELDFKRKGTEKCLTCGADDVHIYSGNKGIDWQLKFENDNDNTITNIQHPNCGGEFYISTDVIRVAMSSDMRTFTINGEELINS